MEQEEEGEKKEKEEEEQESAESDLGVLVCSRIMGGYVCAFIGIVDAIQLISAAFEHSVLRIIMSLVGTAHRLQCKTCTTFTYTQH